MMKEFIAAETQRVAALKPSEYFAIENNESATPPKAELAAIDPQAEHRTVDPLRTPELVRRIYPTEGGAFVHLPANVIHDTGSRMSTTYPTTDAIDAMMETAKYRGWKQITVTGPDDADKKALISAAIEHGLTVAHPEMKEFVAAETKRIEHQQAAESTAIEKKGEAPKAALLPPPAGSIPPCMKA